MPFTHCRWRQEFGDLKSDQAKRHKAASLGVLDVLLDCSFSRPEAGLQNSGWNTMWFVMAKKHMLTCRSLPRPTRSITVRAQHSLGMITAHASQS